MADLQRFHKYANMNILKECKIVLSVGAAD